MFVDLTLSLFRLGSSVTTTVWRPLHVQGWGGRFISFCFLVLPINLESNFLPSLQTDHKMWVCNIYYNNFSPITLTAMSVQSTWIHQQYHFNFAVQYTTGQGISSTVKQQCLDVCCIFHGTKGERGKKLIQNRSDQASILWHQALWCTGSTGICALNFYIMIWDRNNR